VNVNVRACECADPICYLDKLGVRGEIRDSLISWDQSGETTARAMANILLHNHNEDDVTLVKSETTELSSEFLGIRLDIFNFC